MKSRLLVVALVALGVLVSGAAIVYSIYFRRTEDQAIRLVPRASFIYASVFLEPSNDQKRALRDLLATFPAAGTPQEARNRIVEWLDEALREEGLSFAEDIEPWLGDQIAGFGLISSDPEQPVDGAALIASDDDDAARRFLEEANDDADGPVKKRSYKDVDYQVDRDGAASAVFDGFLLVGTEHGLKAAVDAADRGSLDESDEFQSAVELVEDDRLFLFYFDGEQLFTGLEESGVFPPATFGGPLQSLAEQQTAGVLYARPDGVVMESASRVPDRGPAAAAVGRAARGGVVERLPTTAWGAFGINSLGETMQEAFDQLRGWGLQSLGVEAFRQALIAQWGFDFKTDLLAWIGDVALFAQGETPSELGGAALFGSRNPKRSQLAVKKIFALLLKEDAPVRPLPFDAVGFQLKDRGMPQPVNVVHGDDQVVVAYGNAATRAALEGDELANDEDFVAAARALGEDFEAAGYFDIQAIVSLVESFGGGDDPTYRQEVKPNLDPLSHVVFGSKLDGEVLLQRMVIGVR